MKISIKSDYFLQNSIIRKSPLGIESPLSDIELVEMSKSTRMAMQMMEDPTINENKNGGIIAGIVVAAIAAIAYAGSHSDVNLNEVLQQVVEKIDELGPYGYLYFALFYITAEVLALPAAPLTASSGYLFGLVPGFLTGNIKSLP